MCDPDAGLRGAGKVPPRDRRRGLLIVHTGDGKGKTTAALGTAVRAVGRGMRVLVLQFIKGDWFYGELETLAKLDGITIRPLGAGFVGIMGDKKPRQEHRDAARAALQSAREAVESGDWDLVVLDEITYLANLDLVPIDEVLDVLDRRPDWLHVICTGRDAPAELIERADLVTEMRAVKHPFESGIKAQMGIEF